MVFKSEKVVVTQPKSGDFKAFTAICPHQGCTVDTVSNGKIICPCHRSNFSATDGSVISGPATTGLTTVKVTVDGGSIKMG